MLIRLLPQLSICLVEVTKMKKLLYSCCVVVIGVSVSVFLYNLLSTSAWAILCQIRRLMKAALGVVTALLSESLFLLFLPIRLLLQLYKSLAEVIGLKGSLLSYTFVAILFDDAFFAVVA